MKYKDQLITKQWRDKAKEIRERDSCRCYMCHNNCGKLDVHHIRYINDGRMAWEYKNCYLITLCSDCHELIHYFIARYNDYVYDNLIKDE